jgi:release factor glutamine methyltransferase
LAATIIEEALQRASFCLQQAGLDQPRAEAEILLSHLMGLDRLQLFLARSRELSPALDQSFQELTARRARGEPIAYLTGEKYFYGYRFKVNNSVLIPRPETELIIDSVLEWVKENDQQTSPDISCIDLGTGSGILAITLALKLPAAAIWAVDLSEAALKVAVNNAEIHGVEKRIHWIRGSFFESLSAVRPKPSFNLIVSNPPYIRTEEMSALPREVRDYEPAEALEGGNDGLDCYRAVITGLPDYIQSPGLFVVEAGAGQKEEIEALCRKTGIFHSLAWRNDLCGWPRVLEGRV